VGVSNFTPQRIQELIDETEYGIQGAFVQMEIHPWYWRDALERRELVWLGMRFLPRGESWENMAQPYWARFQRDGA
jgi:hypothetical protein